MILCWWCSHDIGKSTVKVPTNFIRARCEADEDIPSFMNPSTAYRPYIKHDVEGFFCSFECARAHLISERRPNYEAAVQTLCHMRRVTIEGIWNSRSQKHY